MNKLLVPTIQVIPKTSLIRVRELPIPGKILVEVGDVVKSDQIVAQAELEGEIQVLRLAEIFSLSGEQVRKNLLVSQGDPVAEQQVVFHQRALFGLINQQAVSPCTGVVETFSELTGNLTIRELPKMIKIDAYIEGIVVGLLDNKRVEIKTDCALVQGIFGVGGERQGRLYRLNVEPHSKPLVSALPDDCSGLVLFGGTAPDASFLKEASQRGAKGLVVGAIDDVALKDYVGFDIGVAITGDEDISMTLIITEGFGNLAMSKRVLSVLETHSGRFCSLNGATQVRAGAIRPEIIITLDENSCESSLPEIGSKVSSALSLEVGRYVRLLRFPHFGKVAQVVDLPEKPQRIATGAHVRVLQARLLDSSKSLPDMAIGADLPKETGDPQENSQGANIAAIVTVPRTNVEVIG